LADEKKGGNFVRFDKSYKMKQKEGITEGKKILNITDLKKSKN
jgi:hypothetical protein